MEDEINHDTPMKNYITILKMDYEATTTSLERLTVLSNNGGEEMLSSSPLDPYGFNMVMDERSSLGDLQRVAFQNSMKCKERDLVWEDGSHHGRITKRNNGRRHPQLIEWMWMRRKRLVSHLQIYDTRQQEAWLRWLLLKEFGHHLAYPFTKRRGMEKRWQDASIIG